MYESICPQNDVKLAEMFFPRDVPWGCVCKCGKCHDKGVVDSDDDGETREVPCPDCST